MPFRMLLASFLLATLAFAQQSYLWIRSPINGREYALSGAGTWLATEQVARSLGAHLATIRSPSEQQWVETTFGVAENLWIGLNDAANEGRFVWASGETSTWTHWCPNEPNGAIGGRPDEDYVHLAAFPGQCSGAWNDAPEDRAYRGLMERTGRATSLTWSLVRGITGRSGHGAAFDPNRQVSIVMDTLANGRQMEFDPANGWSLVSASGALPPLTGYAIAPDPVRRRVVLFGGRTQAGQYGGTWLYDGRGWGSGGLPTEPPPRTGHAMAYDEAARVVVLYGGLSPSGALLDDTWVLDGNGWNRMFMTTPPPPRHLHGMAFDSHSRRVLLIGGAAQSQTRSDVWSWDGSAWRPQPALPYGGRYAAAVGQGPHGGVMVVDGVDGRGWIGTEVLLWEGANWRNLGFRQATLRRDAALIRDPLRGVSTLIGGTSFDVYDPSRTFGTYAEIESYDGTSWVRDGMSPPGPRADYGVAVDVVDGGVLIAGGARVCVNLNEMWEFDGDRWAVSPLGTWQTYGIELVYDSTRRRTYAIGGEEDDCGRYGNWTGPGWLPPPFHGLTVTGHTLAYDAGRDRLMLIGGTFYHDHSSGSYPNPGVLEYDPSSGPQGLWQLVVPSVPRNGGIVYMPPLRSCILQDSSGLWRWDGQDWRGLGTAPGWISHYDPTRERMVFFGSNRTRAWSWDGTSFVEDIVSGPAPDAPGYGFYHPGRRCYYVVGSESTDLWTLRASGIAHHSIVAPGCSGSLGVPTPRTERLPWIGETLLVQFDNVPVGASVAVILGLSDRWLAGGFPLPVDLSPIGMTGCQLANSIDDAVPAPSGRWTMGIPNDPVFVGATFFDQAIVVDPLANPFGAVLSAGSRAIVGSR